MIDSNSLKGPLGRSLISITLMITFGILFLINVVSPLLDTSKEVEETQTDSLISQHDIYVAIDIARFNGRSAFFKPIRKAPPPKRHEPIPEPPEEIPTRVVDPTPLPPDPEYRGPPLIAIIGEEAWFRGTGTGIDSVIRLKIGEEDNGLTLVATAEPATATVRYRRGEYQIDLFSHEESFFTLDVPVTKTHDFLEEVDVTTDDSPLDAPSQ